MSVIHEVRIAVIAPERRRLDELVRIMQEIAGADKVSAIESTLEKVAAFGDQPVPDILIVDSGREGSSDLDQLAQLGVLYRNMAFIVLCDQPSPDFLMKAMRVGVREVVPSPLSADTLKAAVERIQVQLGFASVTKAKILAFVSCKGGSGATFLASNLAYALSALGKKVALFDCHLQFGDALLFLTDAKPVTTLSDVALNIHRLDPAFLASSMVSVAPNLSVLPAPDDPAEAMEVTPDHMDALLKMARHEYDFIVIDVSRTLDAQTIKVLDYADTIFGVLQLTLPYIRDGKRLLDIFDKLDYPKSKIQLIVNRYEKGGEISLADLEKSFGKAAERTIPNHYSAVASSVNQGIPVIKLAQASPVAKALVEWSTALIDVPAQRRSNWIDRVFKRAKIEKKEMLQDSKVERVL
jgi:pilus assembly protein CpaE